MQSLAEILYTQWFSTCIFYIALCFMENIFLEKIQTTVNQRKHIHNNVLSEVPHTIKIQNFDHQNCSDFFLQKNLFFFARVNRFLYF